MVLVEVGGGRAGAVPGDHAALVEVDAAAGHVVEDQAAVLVVAELGDQDGVQAQPGQPDRDVERRAAGGVLPLAVDRDDDVDERLPDQDERGAG